MSNRALLVGSSYSAIPLLFALKERGLEVWVVGSSREDPGHQLADKSFFIDYSKRDDLLELVRSLSIDYLVPTCNDYSYLSAAWVAELCGFPGYDAYDTALAIHTKRRFRDITAANGIPAPKELRLNGLDGHNSAEKFNFPVLVKPNDSFSGRGMAKVSNIADLPKAIENAVKSSRLGEALVEEFVEGTLHSHSAFIQGGAIACDFFVDEFCSVYPYQVDCSNHPSRLPAAVRDGVRAAILKLAAVMKLSDGLIHTQFIAKEDRFWLIESMRRGPGDLYGRLAELSTGVPYHDLMVRQYLGEDYNFTTPAAAIKPYSRHTISVSEPTIVHSFSQDMPALHVNVVPLKSSGERLAPAPYDKLAILFACHHDELEMHEYTRCWAKHVTIQSANGATGGTSDK